MVLFGKISQLKIQIVEKQYIAAQIVGKWQKKNQETSWMSRWKSLRKGEIYLAA